MHHHARHTVLTAQLARLKQEQPNIHELFNKMDPNDARRPALEKQVGDMATLEREIAQHAGERDKFLELKAKQPLIVVPSKKDHKETLKGECTAGGGLLSAADAIEMRRTAALAARDKKDYSTAQHRSHHLEGQWPAHFSHPR